MLHIQWVSIIWLLFYIHIFTHKIICFEKLPEYEVNVSKTENKYWLQVNHSHPMTINDRNGSVLINASVIGKYQETTSCTWSLNVDGVILNQVCKNISKTYSLPWYFRKPGLKIATVGVRFTIISTSEEHFVENSTTINVTDCSRELHLLVSTSKKTFNVSKNQSEVVLDSPGFINFTVFVFNIIDPFHVCHPLSYSWNFGDNEKGDVTKKDHMSHFYNSSGVFNMSLDVLDPSKHLNSVSLTIFVKDVHHGGSSSHAAAIDVLVVLIICVIAIIVITCFIGILRKQGRRFTEVASFDFRHEDFHSENERVFCKPGFLRNFMKRQRGDGHEKQLLCQVNSSCSSFGSILPTEEL